MIWSKARFQHSYELLPRVLKEVAPILLPISAILWGLEFYVAWLNKARFANPYQSSMTLMVLVGFFGVIFQCFASVFAMLFVAKSTQKQMKNGIGDSPFRFVLKHFHQSFVEYVRAFISIGIYSFMLMIPAVLLLELFGPLLSSLMDQQTLEKMTIVSELDKEDAEKASQFMANIDVLQILKRASIVGLYFLPFTLPGLLRWINLQFTILVVAFDPSYQEGKKDALTESSRLIKGAWIPLFLFIILTSLVPVQLEEWAKEGVLPLSAVPILYGTSWILNLYFAIYFSLTFFARWSFKLERT